MWFTPGLGLSSLVRFWVVRGSAWSRIILLLLWQWGGSVFGISWVRLGYCFRGYSVSYFGRRFFRLREFSAGCAIVSCFALHLIVLTAILILCWVFFLVLCGVNFNYWGGFICGGLCSRLCRYVFMFLRMSLLIGLSFCSVCSPQFRILRWYIRRVVSSGDASSILLVPCFAPGSLCVRSLQSIQRVRLFLFSGLSVLRGSIRLFRRATHVRGSWVC